jgi:hypothetical protein
MKRWLLLFLAACTADVGSGAGDTCEALNRTIGQYEAACEAPATWHHPKCSGLVWFDADVSACRRALLDLSCVSSQLPSECKGKHFP